MTAAPKIHPPDVLDFLEAMPDATPDSHWDTIFLVPPEQMDFGIMIAWCWQNCINPDGEAHELWRSCQ